jgi:hypothetical protein
MEEMGMKRLLVVVFSLLFLVGCGATAQTDVKNGNTSNKNSSPAQAQVEKPVKNMAVSSTSTETTVQTGGDPVNIVKDFFRNKLGVRIVNENVEDLSKSLGTGTVGANIAFVYTEKDNQKIQQELLGLVRELGKCNVDIPTITLSVLSPTSKKPVGSISFYRTPLKDLVTADDQTILDKADTKFFDITRE